MILKVGAEVWHLHFHIQDAESDEERAKRGLAPLLWDILTTCAVHTGPCVWSSTDPKYCLTGLVGTSKCSKRDQFVRRMGAKQALQRAIRGFPEELRKQIWQAYWLKVRRPKEKPENFKRRLLNAQKAA